jgi:signal transduction histidine kinase
VTDAVLLGSLLGSVRSLAAEGTPEAVLEGARRESERMLGARTTLATAAQPAGEVEAGVTAVPIEGVGATLLVARPEPLSSAEIASAQLLAEFARRAHEAACLRAEASARGRERAQLADQLLTAEQDERRRLALFLHDTSLQTLSGIALMLDAGQHSISAGRSDEALTIVAAALERLRRSIGELRDLSFALEPVVLRDQGFGPAVGALTERLGLEQRIAFEVDVAAAEDLSEKAQAALYQIVREAINFAVLRGPPARVAVHVRRGAGGRFEAVVADDAPGERRRGSYEAIVQRAGTLSGDVSIEPGGPNGGTTVRVNLPPYAARG